MPMTNNDNINNTTQPALNLVDLPLDTLILICEHLNMQEACSLYRTGSINLRKAIAETEFDFYTTGECIPPGVSVKQFRKVFANAIGIKISEPFKLTPEDFDYMVPSLCKDKPQGLEKVKIDMSTYYGALPMHNGDWINKAKYNRNAFNKLRGIHKLDISNNYFVKYRHIKSLKDIKYLNMSGCNQIEESVLQYLTKVKCLALNDCSRMTNKALTYLKSDDLETLDISKCYKITKEALEQFSEKYPNLIWYADHLYHQEDPLDDYHDHEYDYPDEDYEDYDCFGLIGIIHPTKGLKFHLIK